MFPKKPFYISFPSFSHQSIKMKSELELLFGKYFPHLDVKIIFVNTITIGSFFNCRDTIPVCFWANIEYSFSGVQSCTSEYTGSSIRCLSEHMGISFCTKYPIAKPPQSAIRNNFNFKILDTAKELINLRIMESI